MTGLDNSTWLHEIFRESHDEHVKKPASYCGPSSNCWHGSVLELSHTLTSFPVMLSRYRRRYFYSKHDEGTAYLNRTVRAELMWLAAVLIVNTWVTAWKDHFQDGDGLSYCVSFRSEYSESIFRVACDQEVNQELENIFSVWARRGVLVGLKRRLCFWYQVVLWKLRRSVQYLSYSVRFCREAAFWCRERLLVLIGRTKCHAHLLFMTLPSCENILCTAGAASSASYFTAAEFLPDEALILWTLITD